MSESEKKYSKNYIISTLFSLIKVEIGEECSVSADALTDERLLAKVCELADFHDMAHLISGALEKLSSAPKSGALADAIAKKQLRAILRSELIDCEIEAVSSLFETEKIDHLPLKGAVIREFYPEKWMRTSGDIDILVRREDMARASSLLEERLDYKRHGSGTYDVTFISPSGVQFELHHGLMSDDIYPEPLKNAWEWALPQKGAEHRYRMSEEMLLFYHTVHAAKHVLHGGCGIKPMLDLHLMLKQPEIANNIPTKLLCEQGFERFFDAMKKLSRVWFGGAEHEGVTAELEKYILGAGTYGSIANLVAVGQLQSGGKLRFFFSRVFPAFDTMKSLYPCLNKHKWLLPVCHVRRWFRIVFKGDKNKNIGIITSVAEDNSDKKNKVSSLFSALGLR